MRMDKNISGFNYKQDGTRIRMVKGMKINHITRHISIDEKATAISLVALVICSTELRTQRLKKSIEANTIGLQFGLNKFKDFKVNAVLLE
ncbi:hypothetical protein J4E06_06470 [Muricauda sp. NFXS6]|uniref:hypothetical protein n=1 Tax=Allomuricauda sp. NFXS6 TaxID=2819094 RepID=UPI0032DE6BBC